MPFHFCFTKKQNDLLYYVLILYVFVIFLIIELYPFHSHIGRELVSCDHQVIVM